MSWLGILLLALVLYIVAEVFVLGFLVPVAVIVAIVGLVLLFVDLFGRGRTRV